MLLANVGGSSTARPRLMTAAGLRTSMATAAHNQDRESPNGDDKGHGGDHARGAAVGPVADDQPEDQHDGGGEQVTASIADQAAEHEGAAPDGQGPEAVEYPGGHVLGEAGAPYMVTAAMLMISVPGRRTVR